MTHTLPNLSYSYEDLEPYIDSKTMEIHHTKHHQGYINNLNKTLENHADLAQLPIEDLLKKLDTLPTEIKIAVQNNGGGHYNHSLFWESLKPNAQALTDGALKTALTETFGSTESFIEKFNTAATTRFGSGWAWLVVSSMGDLEVVSTPNQDNPISMGVTPLLGLDVWEHAYYLNYQNRRADYVAAFWNIVNWNVVESRYESVKK